MFLSTYHRAQLLLLTGLIASYLVFAFASRQFHVPANAGFDGSFLIGPAPLVSLLVLAVALLISAAVSTLIAGTVRFDAGLFCGTAGMTALTFRSGRMGDVMRQYGGTHGPALFIWLAVELLALYAIVAVAGSALWVLHKNGLLKADEFRDGVEDTDEPLVIKAAALAMQVCVMALVVMLAAQSDAKAQVLAAVGIGSFAGACVAYMMYPISPSVWLWAGPLILGAVGYAMAYFTVGGDGGVWTTGQFSTTRSPLLTFAVAPLARPLPIDYATAGPAGAILGYWMSRRWHRQRIEEMTESEGSKQATVDAFDAARRGPDGSIPPSF